jgi:hypothetical protein
VTDDRINELKDARPARLWSDHRLRSLRTESQRTTSRRLHQRYWIPSGANHRTRRKPRHQPGGALRLLTYRHAGATVTTIRPPGLPDQPVALNHGADAQWHSLCEPTALAAGLGSVSVRQRPEASAYGSQVGPHKVSATGPTPVATRLRQSADHSCRRLLASTQRRGGTWGTSLLCKSWHRSCLHRYVANCACIVPTIFRATAILDFPMVTRYGLSPSSWAGTRRLTFFGEETWLKQR